MLGGWLRSRRRCHRILPPRWLPVPLPALTANLLLVPWAPQTSAPDRTGSETAPPPDAEAGSPAQIPAQNPVGSRATGHQLDLASAGCSAQAAARFPAHDLSTTRVRTTAADSALTGAHLRPERLRQTADRRSLVRAEPAARAATAAPAEFAVPAEPVDRIG